MHFANSFNTCAQITDHKLLFDALMKISIQAKNQERIIGLPSEKVA